MTSRIAVVCLAVAATMALLLAQGVTMKVMVPQLADGRGITEDGYTWLGRVRRLHDTGAWYDRKDSRINWPYGETLHQHRPFDVLLLAGASALTPWLGFESGLFWWGAMSAPVCYLLLGLSLAWAAAAVLGRWRGPLALLILPTQFGILNYSIAGRADHHVLILTVAVLTWGLVSRVLLNPEDRRNAWLAGIVAGLGFWLSIEFMLMLAGTLAGIALAWVRRGGHLGRAGLDVGTGFLGMMAVALLAERPPADLLIPQYDRLSIVHFFLAAIGWAFLATLAWTAKQRKAESVGERVKVVLWSAGIGLGTMALVFPEFFLGPLDIDPRARLVHVSTVTEFQGLWPRNFTGLVNLALMLGIAVPGLPGLLYLLVRARTEPRADVWASLGLLAAVFVPASLYMMRFVPFAELVLLIVTAEILARWVERSGDGAPGRRPLWPVVALGALVLTMTAYGNASLVAAAFAEPAPCHKRLKQVADVLNDWSTAQQRPFTLVAMPDEGPELLYRTQGRVIATPSRSNMEGSLAIYDLLGDVDDRMARSIVDERDIDHILLCRALAMPASLVASDRLYARLVRGDTPGWLEKVPLPASLDEYYVLFRTRK